MTSTFSPSSSASASSPTQLLSTRIKTPKPALELRQQASSPGSESTNGKATNSSQESLTETPRKVRPSLSDRTVDTLSQMAQSPTLPRSTSNQSSKSIDGAKSSSRPASSMERRQAPLNGLALLPSEASSKTASPSLRRPVLRTPLTSPSTPRGRQHDDRLVKQTPKRTNGALTSRNQSPLVGLTSRHKLTPSEKSTPQPGSARQRPVFGRPTPSSKTNTPTRKPAASRSQTNLKKPSPTFSSGSETPSTSSRASKASSNTTVSSPTHSKFDDTTPRDSKGAKSSSALREAIAKAKASRRAGEKSPERAPSTPTTPMTPGAEFETADGFDFDFRPGSPTKEMVEGKNIGLLRKRVEAARIQGSLNISAMGLKSIPAEVLHMYDLESIDTAKGEWYESVDLVRFIAADNELAEIAADVFPDMNPAQDDQGQGNQFGAVELLDLRGNLLHAVPLGLRRLERLSSLNLSGNSLTNDCLDTISQCRSIRELRLSCNSLQGSLPSCVAKMSDLAVLDVRGNALNDLPASFGDLRSLRVLNINENKFSNLPAFVFNRLSLVELLAADNDLEGTLFPDGVEENATLQNLQLAHNALVAVAGSSGVSLPALQQLNISCNRVSSLPDLSSWVQLLDLVAEHNKLSSLPEGFTSLPRIKNVNLTSNDIKLLDDRIGRMESLDVFIVSNNPLRHRKYLNMVTDDLKQELYNKLAAADAEAEEKALAPRTDGSQGTDASGSGPPPPDPDAWPVKFGGILDRSSTSLTELEAHEIERAARHQEIRSLQLQRNKLNVIPPTLSLMADTLQSLNLSHNPLKGSTYLPSALSLPRLQNLNLSNTSLESLEPLTQYLDAPRLAVLDVSINRLTSLPTLTADFPALHTLLASDNAIAELQVEAIKGLRIVNLKDNDIGHLPPRVGFLQGLHTLEVGGNRFKVPRWTVLEQGTEATMAWLRDRVPADERADVEASAVTI
ncbi:MAG: hypothetical protein M1825_002138 [Sarcosagium campestre]|nr:MAG: hypothetical protein M1825_002138 [Sarcosagium campestre]